MRRLMLGFGLGGLLAYGWRRLLGPEVEPEPAWRPPADERASLDDELIDRARPDRPAAEQSQTAGETEPAVEPERSA
jgi:hypothetical protein